MSETRGKRKMREARQRQILSRYHKNRQRNRLATPGAHEFILVLDRLKAGYNVPKIFRSAQAFGAAGIHLIDIDPFDPAPAKGAFRKVPATFTDQFSESYESLIKDNYHLFALSPDADLELPDARLPSRSAFIFGHEEWGLQFDNNDYPEIRMLKIPQVGNMDSLNVSIAASIVMYEYTRQHSHP